MEKTDILVGLPTYNVEETVARVMRRSAEGLRDHFPGCRGLVAVSDGNSQDGTLEAARTVELPSGVKRLIFGYRGISGKGTALRGIFEVAERLGAKAVVVVDADLKSITPDWIELLARKVYSGEYDLIAPLYERHRFDGTITKSICYPFTRALYGLRIRQPIGGDFGLSGRLVQRLLVEGDWQSDISRFGIDIWLTTTAICEGFKIAQARLGTKDHGHKDPAADLRDMFGQVVGTLFSLMQNYENEWKSRKASRMIDTFGESPLIRYKPVHIDHELLTSGYRKGLESYGELWRSILGPHHYNQLEGFAELNGEHFVFPILTWVKTVYDYAGVYFGGDYDRNELLNSLIPLYFGRTAGYKNEVLTETELGVERVLELQCQAFEIMKPYLIQKCNPG